MFGNKRLSHSDQAPGLVAEEPGGFDDLFYIYRAGLSQLECCGVASKERGRDQVYPRIGALRGEDRRAQQLECISVVEGALSVGVEGSEMRVKEGGRVGGSAGKRFTLGALIPTRSSVGGIGNL
jgi:hypothetical protein